MRPTTTLLKGALGSVFHAGDVARSLVRRADVPAPPTRPGHTIADIAHWYVPSRTEYLLRTIAALRSQAGVVSILLITNEPDPAIGALGDLGDEITRFDGDGSGAARHLLQHPGAMASVTWRPPRTRTHPFELTWAHKAFMRSVVLEHDGFHQGLTHLVHVEDDMEFAPGALDYWVRARPVLDPHGLLPGFSRWEGRDGDRRITDQTHRVSLSEVATLDAALDADGDERVTWVNLPNPHQGCFILDAPLAEHHLTVSRFLSPARSLSGPKSWGRDLGLIERSAIGPICEGVPPGYTTRNVVPVDTRPDPPQLLPVCLIEHQPANYYLKERTGFARIPLDETFRAQDQAPTSFS